jgi:hypothetical protein
MEDAKRESWSWATFLALFWGEGRGGGILEMRLGLVVGAACVFVFGGGGSICNLREGMRYVKVREGLMGARNGRRKGGRNGRNVVWGG